MPEKGNWGSEDREREAIRVWDRADEEARRLTVGLGIERERERERRIC